MKKILLALAVPLVLSSCYKDKGSYDYDFDSLNEIREIKFTPDGVKAYGGIAIEFQQPLKEDKVERISLDIDQSLGKNFDNLDFYWITTRTVDGKTVRDTVTTKGYYEVPLRKGLDTAYTVLLEIKDKETTISNFTKVQISTRPIFKNSLFFLHGNDGYVKLGNIENISGKDVIRTDAYKAVYEDATDSPMATAEALAYTTGLSGKGTTNSLLIMNSDGESSIYDPFGLKYKYGRSYIYPKSAQHVSFDQMIEVGTNTTLSDYKMLISKSGDVFFTKSYFTFRKPAEDSKSNFNITDYSVTAGTIDRDNFVVWDNKNKAFLYASKYDNFRWDEAVEYRNKLRNPLINAEVDLSPMTDWGIDPEEMRAVYAYVQYGNEVESNPFFVFKNTSDNSFFLAELLPMKEDKDKKTRGDDKEDDKKDDEKDDKKDDEKDDKKDDKKEEKNPPQYRLVLQEMRNFKIGSNISTLRYNPWFSTNILFYTDGTNVYKYNTSTGDNIVLYKAPEGYKISILKFKTPIMKFATKGSHNYDESLGRYLTIGMSKGNEGAIAELKLTTSSDLDNTVPIKFFDTDNNGVKFGKIKDVAFAHLYLYFE